MNVFKWDLSKGKKLEKVLDIAKWVFIILQAIIVTIRIIWYGNGKTFHTVLATVFWIFALCWLGCFVAELIVFKRNMKCEEISLIKKRIETPQNMIKVITKIHGRDGFDVSMSGDLTLGTVAEAVGIDFERAEFEVVGNGYVYPKDKNKTIAEVVGEDIALIVINMDDKKPDKEVIEVDDA